MKKFLVLFVLALFSATLYGQSGITAGYDTTQYHPMFIKSANGKYSLNIGLYTQFRTNFNVRSGIPDSITDQDAFTYGYSLPRTRIFFEGNLTEKFYYHTRININGTGNFEFFVAYLQWNINKKMWLRMGKQFMALGREDWAYPQDLASVEFSANDFTFAIWSSFGFQFRHVVSDQFRYFASVGNGAYGGRQGFAATPAAADLALIGRAEWNIIGDSWGLWDDMVSRPGKDFGMMLGVGVGHARRFDNTVFADSGFRVGNQVNVDFSVAGNGFQGFVQGSFTTRTYDENIGIGDNTVGGVYGTFGYWLNNHWFPYARFDYVSRGDINLPGVDEDYVAPGVGITYYPFTWSNRTRFTLEYNYLAANINRTIVAPDGQLGWVAPAYGAQQALRLQIQFGF